MELFTNNTFQQLQYTKDFLALFLFQFRCFLFANTWKQQNIAYHIYNRYFYLILLLVYKKNLGQLPEPKICSGHWEWDVL